MIGNISFAVPKTYCDLGGRCSSTELPNVFFLLNSLQILIFHGSKRTLPQLGRDSGPQIVGLKGFGK